MYVVKYIVYQINAMFRTPIYLLRLSKLWIWSNTFLGKSSILGQHFSHRRDLKRNFRSLASAILNCHVDLYVLNAISMKTSILFGGSAYFNNDKKKHTGPIDNYLPLKRIFKALLKSGPNYFIRMFLHCNIL